MVGVRGRLVLALCLGALSPMLIGTTGRTAGWEARVLAAHNRERAALGLPPQRWDAGLAGRAAGWAAHLAQTGALAHSPDDGGEEDAGENLWAGTAGAFTPEAMTGLWARERRDFRQGTFPANSRTGQVADVAHYTQMIWRRSGELGCALAGGRDYDVLVCRYAEPGNVMGERPY